MTKKLSDLTTIKQYGDFNISSDITSDTTCEPNYLYVMDTTSSTITMTLPSVPKNGTRIAFWDSKNKFATHNVTLSGYNNKGNLVLDMNGGFVEVVFSDGLWQMKDSLRMGLYVQRNKNVKTVIRGMNLKEGDIVNHLDVNYLANVSDSSFDVNTELEKLTPIAPNTPKLPTNALSVGDSFKKGNTYLYSGNAYLCTANGDSFSSASISTSFQQLFTV